MSQHAAFAWGVRPGRSDVVSPSCETKGAQQRSRLLDTAERRSDPLPPPAQLGTGQRRHGARRDRHVARLAAIVFAAPDQQSQSAILAGHHTLNGESDPLGAPQQKFVAERQHRRLAQAPGCAGLRGLSRGRIGLLKNGIRFGQRGDAPPQGRGEDARRRAVDKWEDRGGGRGERLYVARSTPRGEGVAINTVGSLRARVICVRASRPGGLPILRHDLALCPPGWRQRAGDRSQVNGQGAVQHYQGISDAGCAPFLAIRELRLVTKRGVPWVAVQIAHQGNQGEGRRAAARRTPRHVGDRHGASVVGRRQRRDACRDTISALFQRSMA